RTLPLALATLASLLPLACGGEDDAGCQATKGTPARTWPVDGASGLRVADLPPLPDLPVWEDNPVTPEKRTLGVTLFSDLRLSSSGTVSCANCHSPLAEFQSNTPLDLPSRSLPEVTPPLPRHTPSLLNLVYADVLHWDGSESDLYESMVLPFAEPNMNLTDVPRGDVWTIDVPTAQRKLREKVTTEIPGYGALFQAAFGEDPADLTPEEVWHRAGQAMAVFIRDAVSKNSPFDRWNAGEDGAISDAAVQGLDFFMGAGKCIECHRGPMITDYEFHNLSLMRLDDAGEPVDLGRARITKDPADLGKFLTPTLRSVNRTSPFLHDGHEASLLAVLEHHANGPALESENHDPILEGMARVGDDEYRALVALIKSFEGEPLDLDFLGTIPEFPK
ncbi:MAG: hypothetical protein FJ104_02845, partial [Deltaproteobacteria bacterium]|nr:hypothetical protein [Deltaproteobacteria bacterium]